MLEKIESILQNECRLEKDRPIVVGVSGGPDSLCLLDVLRRAGYPVQVAHFDHRLRPESKDEAARVGDLAARLKLPFATASADVHAFAEQNGQSIEEAARQLRYEFLFEQTRACGAQAVAVGHNADDQVETVLMHFLRGAGLNGLRGMAHRTLLAVFDPAIPVVRPLLEVWRSETVAYCESHGLEPHHDPSNASLDYFRNRVRNALIPELETYNPKFREAAWRAARTLREDHALMQELLGQAWAACVVSQVGGQIGFQESALTTYPAALRRGLIRRAVELLSPRQESSYAALERAAAFVADRSAKAIELPGGLRLAREEGCLYLLRSDTELASHQWPQMPAEGSPIQVTLPALVRLPDGWWLTGEGPASATQARDQAEHNRDPLQAWLDAGTLPGSLELRVRRPGDRFDPLGLDGHSQKLSDFFVNEKLSQRARDRWPLLCSGETIVWVPGYRPAHRYRLTPNSQEAVHFMLARSTGEPDN